MLKSKLSLAFAGMVGLSALVQPPSAQAQSSQPPAAPTLPGGASSLQENFDDWRVVCGIAPDKSRECLMQQQQADSKTGRRVFAVELQPAGKGGVSGSLVMPFGLSLASGVSLGLDGSATGKPQPFKTCLPAGCVVPVSLDAAMVTSLRSGKLLKLTAKPAEDLSKNVVLPISLKGFGAAYDRLTALLK